MHGQIWCQGCTDLLVSCFSHSRGIHLREWKENSLFLSSRLCGEGVREPHLNWTMFGKPQVFLILWKVPFHLVPGPLKQIDLLLSRCSSSVGYQAWSVKAASKWGCSSVRADLHLQRWYITKTPKTILSLLAVFWNSFVGIHCWRWDSWMDLWSHLVQPLLRS